MCLQHSYEQFYLKSNEFTGLLQETKSQVTNQMPNLFLPFYRNIQVIIQSPTENKLELPFFYSDIFFCSNKLHEVWRFFAHTHCLQRTFTTATHTQQNHHYSLSFHPYFHTITILTGYPERLSLEMFKAKLDGTLDNYGMRFGNKWGYTWKDYCGANGKETNRERTPTCI